MSELEIHQFPCRSDNYGVLVHDASANVTASIDAPDAAAVQKALGEKGWHLTHIFTTHHHGDHTVGNAQLKAQTNCTIIGPKAEAAKIPGIDIKVAQGDKFTFGGFEVEVLDTPGHTTGHVSFVIPGASAAFVGDTMFAMGCGRLFEGSPQMMWNSLQKLMALPPETHVYCGHEYTLANARFALTVDPDNAPLRERVARVEAQRERGEPTLPTTIRDELETNPFLRAANPAVRKHLGLSDAQDWEVFAKIRSLKDNA